MADGTAGCFRTSTTAFPKCGPASTGTKLSIELVQQTGTARLLSQLRNGDYPPFLPLDDPSRRGHQQQKSVILDLLLVVS